MRSVKRWAATAPLAVLYAIGWIVGKTVLIAFMVGSAVKLGWTDARSGGGHGSA